MAFSDSDSSASSISASSASSGGRQRPAGPAVRRSQPSALSHDVRAEPPAALPSETSSLLNHLNDGSREHGTFSQDLPSPSTGTDLVYPSDEAGDRREPQKGPSWRARLSRRVKSKKVRYSRALAREAGVESNKMM